MTKTVAEIIWDVTAQPCCNRRNYPGTPAAQSCEAIDCTEYVSPHFERVEYSADGFGEPTVDDIRVWLQGQDVSVWAGENVDTPLLLNGDWVFLDLIQNNLDHPNCTSIKSETMLGALEAVVRLLSL